MSFSAGMIGTNKREVREKLYDDVSALLKNPTRFAMLAGGAPGEEIDCIRRRFFRPQITAFDLAQSCIDAAISCGVEGVNGNVAFTTVLAGRTFDVFDLDLCRTVKTSERAIRAAAQVTSGALAIFASYRDNASSSETTNALERASVQEAGSRCTPTAAEQATQIESSINEERAKDRETTMAPERAIQNESSTRVKLTDAQQSRINDALRVIRDVRPGAQLRRCYAYKGNALNMIGLLVYFGRKQIETLPPFCPHREEESHARRYRLRTLGVGGEKLEKRIRAGVRGARG